MKNLLKNILQRILGFENYLLLFSLFKIRTLRIDKKENDFFFFLNLIGEDAGILDIGANIGIMTVHLARMAKNGTVYAFEPIPDNVNILRKIVSHFKLKNVKIFDIALGDKNGKIEMVMPVVDSVKMQGLSHVVHPSINEYNEGNKFSVEVRTLDDLFGNEHKNVEISAIKIDVENFEYFVLKGAEQLLRKFKPVIYIELWDNENRNKCFDFFEKMGYTIKVVENGNLEKFDETKHRKQNFVVIQ